MGPQKALHWKIWRCDAFSNLVRYTNKVTIIQYNSYFQLPITVYIVFFIHKFSVFRSFFRPLLILIYSTPIPFSVVNNVFDDYE